MAHLRPSHAQGNQSPSIPGLIRGPITGLGWTTERWSAGEHADRRVRELRKALGPGAVTTATDRNATSLWKGNGGETLLVTVIRYPGGATVPAPSAAGAVRSAFRRELYAEAC